jgi:signal peptidase I, bacterial type
LKRSQLVREIVEILALTLLIFLIVRFVVQSYHIDGQSMDPGLQNGEFVMVNKTAYLFSPPERGDVIVFHYPHNTQLDYIKRVIGLPGDTVNIDYQHVYVNGKQLNEPYITVPYNHQGAHWTVPANQYFVMGDNRPVSDDSREWGFVPKDYIIGKAAIVFWPLNAIHFIDTYSDTYKDIPNPKQ